jgi:hypothetical protein
MRPEGAGQARPRSPEEPTDPGTAKAKSKGRKSIRIQEPIFLGCAGLWRLWRCGSHLVTPNGQHQRREPAATEQRIQTELNGWLPSAECCGSIRSRHSFTGGPALDTAIRRSNVSTSTRLLLTL